MGAEAVRTRRHCISTAGSVDQIVESFAISLIRSPSTPNHPDTTPSITPLPVVISPPALSVASTRTVSSTSMTTFASSAIRETNPVERIMSRLRMMYAGTTMLEWKNTAREAKKSRSEVGRKRRGDVETAMP